MTLDADDVVAHFTPNTELDMPGVAIFKASRVGSQFAFFGGPACFLPARLDRGRRLNDCEGLLMGRTPEGLAHGRRGARMRGAVRRRVRAPQKAARPSPKADTMARQSSRR